MQSIVDDDHADDDHDGREDGSDGEVVTEDEEKDIKVVMGGERVERRR